MPRATTDGKFLSLGGRPFRVRGATYGSFRPRLDGELFPETWQVKRDLADMAEAGLNTVRTYTLPPEDVLEVAEELGLRLIVGLHYEDWRYEAEPGRRAHRRVLEAGRRAVADAMERLAGRESVLAVAVGNEVPGDVIRVHGIPQVERTLAALVEEVHAADPGMLATYVNFPTTEYLEVGGQDLFCFNVFLEEPERLRAYVRRLQIVSGDLPLVITELGLAADVHGEEAQAESLEWQLREVDEAGCAGATVFSWTDEWGVDGRPVDGWGFGLTDSERRPKPALEMVSRWTSRGVRDLRESWPRISVVVCAYNEERHIEDCLESLMACDYPGFEVIVCDDGSTDRTAEIARRHPFRVLELEHAGLSAARNAGVAAASGEVVAFLDADAACHPEWPYHLALSLESESVVATGGPNLPDRGAGLVERAVAASPGGPVEVLLSDDRAEHVPGCNMAYRKEALEAIGGFDEVYTSAGDDVDVCWKLRDRGWEIAFSATARIRHHRRDTVRGYLRQQRGYGRSERLVAARHPWRFNRLGQARWKGFIYGGLRAPRRWLRPVIYHGPMGTAPYQGVVRRRSEEAMGWAGALLPLAVPVALLGALSFLSLWWLAGPAVALLAVLGYGAAAAVGARPARHEPHPVRFRLLVGLMSAIQPFVRTLGRLTGPRAVGRAGPRSRSTGAAATDVQTTSRAMAPEWAGDRERLLRHFQRELEGRRCRVRRGGSYDEWDLEAVVGPFWRARIASAVLWGWTPSWRVVMRPRLQLLPTLAAASLVAAFRPWIGLGLAGVLLLALVIEAGWLRHQVRSGIAATTRGDDHE